jgi:hypothetical protein
MQNLLREVSMNLQLVPAEEMRKLLKGSFEHVSSKVEDAVQKDRVRIFGEDVTTVKVVGTFPGYAVAAAQPGKFARIKFEEAQNGTVKIVGHELLKVPIINNENVGDFLFGEAKALIESWTKGDAQSVLDRARAILPFVQERVQHSEPQIIESLVLGIKADRPWKKLYSERADEIKKFVRSEMAELEKAKLNPKFERLYSGELDASTADGYRDLVQSDLNYIGDRIGALEELVSATVESVDHVSEKIAEGDDRDTLVTFLSFSEDLGLDLLNLKSLVAEAVRQFSDVASLGKLYDALAEEFYHYEVAGRFVEQMASKLIDSAK